VLLLDEPTSGIAQRESEAFGRLLVDLRDQTGATFLVIEHDVPLVASIADRMVCLHLGQVIAEGSPRTVLENADVVEAYLGVDQSTIARSGRTSPSQRRAATGTRTKKRPSRGAAASASGRAKKS